MTSSIQSVPGHPVAVPDSNPAHHGLTLVAAILSDSAIICFHVVGTVQPLSLNILGEYQTKDFTFALFGAAYRTPFTVPYFSQSAE